MAFQFLLLFPEMNPKEILHMSDCLIVIMTDQSQKWKTASLECTTDIFVCLILYSSLLHFYSFIHHSPPFFWSYSFLLLLSSLLYLSIHFPLLWTPSIRLTPLSCPYFPAASFCPCLSKECFSNRMQLHNSGLYVNLTFIQCIKNAFFVRVRINLHWVILLRHASRYNTF